MRKIGLCLMSCFVCLAALGATSAFEDMTVIVNNLGNEVNTSKAFRNHGTQDLCGAVLTFNQPRSGDLWIYGMIFEGGDLIDTTPVKRIPQAASAYNLSERFNHTNSDVTYEVLLWDYQPNDPPLAADLMSPSWHGYVDLEHP